MQQQPGPMVQQPVGVVQQPVPGVQQTGVRIGFAHKTITSFGIALIILGTLAIIFGIVPISIGCFPTSYIGTGIWTGIFVIVTGILVCVSGFKKSNCSIIANMVLSIIAAAMAGTALLPLSAVGIASEEGCIYHYWGYSPCDYSHFRTCVAFHSMNLIISIVVTIITIVSACLCCRAVCCHRGPQRAVYYTASGNAPQQVPMVSMATPQGTQLVYMMPATGMQGVQQPMVASGCSQQPAMVMVVQGHQSDKNQPQQQPSAPSSEQAPPPYCNIDNQAVPMV
ncbi:uncharacterized protein LOC100373964 [Saccoglossus kowalevskii]|uniref:Uncharacterized protein LOC100373964 isoform X1 n=1 Tax=Saccoglossus kowalevskii TaxID=10224 RepID=A0ABM0GPS7_SACKO|nr:PREDICTED: uncharacterized protein LOC100373964 isoform X1 [Saccoglossus kowalevskii]XP_006816341.1 PREDICTED: uncharacterized protein LOC100373964 isoform X2 [Saccoglossus kowalevskii]